MDNRTVPTRIRSLALNSQGIGRVQAALEAKWRGAKHREKLTWERKAMLMGIGEATAKRVLQGKRVDRATLRIVFAQLELEWDDRFASDPLPVVEDTAQAPAQNGPGHFRFAWVGAVAVLAVALILGSRSVPQAVPSERAWIPEFQRLLGTGTADFHAARYGQAKVKIDQAVAMVRGNHAPAGELASSLRLSGDIALASGDLSTARARYEESLAIRRGMNQPQCFAPLEEALAEVELKGGRLKAAWNRYSAAVAGYRRDGVRSGEATATQGLGVVRLREGRPQEALDWFAKAEALLARVDSAEDTLASLRSDQALALAAVGEVGRAQEILEACLRHWKEKRHSRWIAATYFKLARVAGEAGDRKAAEGFGRACSQYYREAGDRLGQQECRQLLASTGESRTVQLN